MKYNWKAKPEGKLRFKEYNFKKREMKIDLKMVLVFPADGECNGEEDFFENSFRGIKGDWRRKKIYLSIVWDLLLLFIIFYIFIYGYQ